MRIVLTESQERKLRNMMISDYVSNMIVNEAALPEFSLEELDKCTTFKARLDYCKKMLGSSIGNGSSRVVFQIDDDKVLKLAKNAKGLAQNQEEYDNYFACDEGVLAKSYDLADNASWLVSEYVLPASKKDFPVVFHMTWDAFTDWLYYTNKQYARNGWFSFNKGKMSYDEWEESLEENDDIRELYDYLTNHSTDTADLNRIVNWGLVKRDDGPHLVILDYGLSEEIYNTYYRRR